MNFSALLRNLCACPPSESSTLAPKTCSMKSSPTSLTLVNIKHIEAKRCISNLPQYLQSAQRTLAFVLSGTAIHALCHPFESPVRVLDLHLVYHPLLCVLVEKIIIFDDARVLCSPLGQDGDLNTAHGLMVIFPPHHHHVSLRRPSLLLPCFAQ